MGAVYHKSGFCSAGGYCARANPVGARAAHVGEGTIGTVVCMGGEGVLRTDSRLITPGPRAGGLNSQDKHHAQPSHVLAVLH